MDSGVTAGLFGLGGVVVGVVLTAVVDARARRHVAAEQREQARHARELVAAEQLDEALTRASIVLDAHSQTVALDERYGKVFLELTDGWVRYSPRIRQYDLRVRYSACMDIVAEVAVGDRTSVEVPRLLVARAIGNARSTVAHFMRGDALPATAFPEPDELRDLLGQGDGQHDPMGPLKARLSELPPVEFHATAPTARKTTPEAAEDV